MTAFHSHLRRALAALAVCSLLAACSDKPDGAADARQIAERDALDPNMFKVADLVRENGWQQGEYYNIRFNYSLAPQGSYPQMWALAVKEAADDPDFKSMTTPESVENFIRSTMPGDVMGLQRAAVLAMYEPLKARLSKYPEVIEAFRVHGAAAFKGNATLEALFMNGTDIRFKEIGYTEDVQAGQKIARTVTIAYMKTEKGWVKTP